RTDQGVTYRSWKPVYGFTEIAGNDIVTGVIRDRLSRLVIDLVNGTIYGQVKFAPGSSGYDSLTDKPDLTAWSNTITKNAIDEAEISSQMYVNSARETLAKNLGYTDYSAMAAAAAAGKTIIDGGFLRTSLIQAEAIIAEHVTAAYIASNFLETNKLLVKDGAKIGNFNISGGWLTANAAPGKDVGYIDMRGTNTRIAFGRNLSTAYTADTCTAIISNRNAADTFANGETIGLMATATGGVWNTALIVDGGMRSHGRMQSCEEVLLNDAPANSLTETTCDGFLRQRNYVTQVANDTLFYLPNATAIRNTFKNNASGIGASDRAFIYCNILCTRYSEGRLLVSCNTPIIKAGGDILRDNTANGAGAYNFYMLKGCYVSLVYHNNSWYVTNANFLRITP
ncbi:MAG: hypothetical protein LBV32_06340, partial [Tannerellaceae bacterium]|nr:hypothetical protein [Tannerellaceae bacterium]